MRIILPLVMLLVVLVSGCTMFTTVDYGNGVSIESFEPDFSEISSGEPVTFMAKVRNMGSAPATNVHLVVLGLEDMEDDMTFERLIAPNKAANTPGETVSHDFKWEGPELPRGIIQRYTPTLRVSYNYRTTVVQSISLASRVELLRVKNSGNALPSETKSSTIGPIKLDITASGPIKFWESGEVVFPFKVSIDNVGGGILCSDEECENQNEIELRISLDNGDLVDCEEEKTIKLWKGSSNSFVCEASVELDDDDYLTERLITVDSYYTYFIDKETTVTVEGK